MSTPIYITLLKRFAESKVVDCIAIALLALMVQSEAGTEPYDGKLAVAYVAINRAQASGKDLDEILSQPKQFALNPRLKVSEASWHAARTAYYRQQPDPSKGADHFYNPLVKPWPGWYDEKYMTTRIGHHVFLKLGGF